MANRGLIYIYWAESDERQTGIGPGLGCDMAGPTGHKLFKWQEFNAFLQYELIHSKPPKAIVIHHDLCQVGSAKLEHRMIADIELLEVYYRGPRSKSRDSYRGKHDGMHCR